MTTGRFFAVGVGPGDPALVTIKAIDVIRSAHVIYHAGPAEDRGRALEIVRAYLRPEQSVRAIRSEPMDEMSHSDCYRRCVDEIATESRQGRDIAFITEGDPTLYSTAARIWPLLAAIHPEIPIEVIPGITSVTAAAARVGLPLAQRDETVAIVPGAYHAAELPALMEQFDMLCLLKPAHALPVVEEALRGLGEEWQTVYAENVGTPQEWITTDPASAAKRTAYFSLVLIRRPATSAQPSSRGQVFVVGIGPGDPDLLSRRGLQLIRGADAIVGYEGYLELLEPLHLSAAMHGSPIGHESERAQQALELARAGQRVALVSSGDAGVYGMASLLLEAAEQMADVEIEIVPGVTAATAAAALLGAPLGHDFACISLSDLLTPWKIIARRLETAGQGDFVIAIYNPISQRRTWQLQGARDILLKHRKPETPVGLVDRAYRPGCLVWQTTLGELTTDGVTMETTIIVGNSQTRIINGRMVTPRGYKVPAARSASKGEPTPLLAPRTGESIIKQSFAIIERELGLHNLPPWAFAVVRRMIHASADFEFGQTIRYSADFDTAVRSALLDRRPILTDTEMVLIGIRAALAKYPDVTVGCHLNDPEASELAAANWTRTAAGVRIAAQRYAKPILVIGNAPTALDEALRLVEEDGWRPAAIIGMPVGFVGVEETKSRLLRQSAVPYLTCVGRKGGSAVAAAAMNALIELFGPNSNA